MQGEEQVFFQQIDQVAIKSLLKAWQKEHPSFGIYAMVAEASRIEIPALQAVCKQENVALIGAMFPELIHCGTFKKEGILLTRFNTMPEYLLTQDLSTSSELDHLAINISVLLDTEMEQSLFLIFDAMIPNIASILDHLYLKLADSAGYSGVSAGSETFQPMPCLFDSDTMIQDGLLAIVMPSNIQPLLSHGYPKPKNTIIATSSSGNCIQTINWQPAFKVYQNMAKETYHIEITTENFYELAVHFPFGIVLANGESLIRIPVALSDHGALFCVGEIPENAILTIMEGKAGTLLDAAKSLNRHITDAQGFGLTFYCAGRRMHLGIQKAALELDVIAANNHPISGALSLGEIGTSKLNAYPQFHNAALVYRPW